MNLTPESKYFNKNSFKEKLKWWFDGIDGQKQFSKSDKKSLTKNLFVLSVTNIEWITLLYAILMIIIKSAFIRKYSEISV